MSDAPDPRTLTDADLLAEYGAGCRASAFELGDRAARARTALDALSAELLRRLALAERATLAGQLAAVNRPPAPEARP